MKLNLWYLDHEDVLVVGKLGHAKQFSKFWDATCHVCKKVGHLKVVCRKAGNYKMVSKVATVSTEQTDDNIFALEKG